MKRDPVQKTALAVTRWVGSPMSVLIHSVLFIASFFVVYLEMIPFNEMLLILTTIVSLEAIYLAIFIQMTLNFASQELEEVSEDIEELQEDVEEMNVEDDTEEAKEEARKLEQRTTLSQIQSDLHKLMEDISRLQPPQK